MYQRFDDFEKMRKARKNKNEKAILNMACDLANYYPGKKRSKAKRIYEESEKIADEMVYKIIGQADNLEDLMVFMAAIVKVKAYIDKALPFSIGPNAQYASCLLEERYYGDAWMGMHQDHIVMKLENLYREFIEH